jgi:putative ABC transport system permease protein
VDLFKMAWRNLWRNRRRTLVTISAMSFALFVMIVYTGMLGGYMIGMERSILDLEMGDVQVFAQDFRDNPSIYTTIDDPEALLAPLVEQGFAASGRVLAFGLAAAGESSAGVAFRGIDVARDATVTKVQDEVAQGRWLDPADPKGVVLGRRLTRMLGVSLGDELVVLTQATDGAMAYDLYTVRGVLRGIADATDRSGVFMNAEALRELVMVPEGVHQIIVRRPENLELPAAAAQVNALAGGFDVKTWRQLLPTLASVLESVQGVMLAMYFVFYVAIGMLILNAMLMAVFERIRELGVLKALGVGPFQVMRLILIESGIQTAIAVGVGVALAIPSLLYLTAYGIDLGSLAGVSVMGIAMEPIWRADMNTQAFTTPVIVLVIIVGLAVLYPAIKAAVVQPVEAMRHR